jgi:hypothetical protein
VADRIDVPLQLVLVALIETPEEGRHRDQLHQCARKGDSFEGVSA